LAQRERMDLELDHFVDGHRMQYRYPDDGLYDKIVKSEKKSDLKANMCSGTCAGSSQLISACVTAVCGGILHKNIHS
jgi:hypothetical protein